MDWAVGRWIGLDHRAERLLDDLEGMPFLVADGRLAQAQLAVARGEWNEALSLLDLPELLNVDDGCAPELSAASAVRVRAWAGARDPARAAEEGRRGLERERAKGMWGWSGELVREAVEVFIDVGHLADACAAVDDLAAGITGRDTPLAAAMLLTCRANLAEATGDVVGAATLHERARQSYERLPRPYDAARAQERVAWCRIAGGDRAEDVLTLAAERYAALGAAYDAARCGHLLRSQGGTTPRRRGRRGYGGELSPRERDVARLMGLGRTNREIAEVLFLSTRTVELHAARVLRKLGVADRALVADRLR
jgi:DNA-binding CsgD family transcriptional regulator